MKNRRPRARRINGSDGCCDGCRGRCRPTAPALVGRVPGQMNDRISRDVPIAPGPRSDVVTFSCLRDPGALFVRSAFRFVSLLFRLPKKNKNAAHRLNSHRAVDKWRPKRGQLFVIHSALIAFLFCRQRGGRSRSAVVAFVLRALLLYNWIVRQSSVQLPARRSP